jgi:hypothetical protein
VPDLLEKKFPQFDHWVFAGVGERLERTAIVSQVSRFRLDGVVYLMNLNDIVPDVGAPGASSWADSARESWIGRLDWTLRGRSYLYTHVRFALKNALERRGYEHHGMEAFEFEPTKNRAVIEATALRVIDALRAAEAVRALRTCVVILPYEMQVSPDAAQTYRRLGFSWGEEFERGRTQELLMTTFAHAGVLAFDARDAFRGASLQVGEAFVYNKGDRTDWNHPNRRGHELLAAWLAARPEFVSRCLGVLN